MLRWVLGLLTLVTVACGGVRPARTDDPSADAGEEADGGDAVDASVEDAGTEDGGEYLDAGTTDGGDGGPSTTDAGQDAGINDLSRFHHRWSGPFGFRLTAQPPGESGTNFTFQSSISVKWTNVATISATGGFRAPIEFQGQADGLDAMELVEETPVAHLVGLSQTSSVAYSVTIHHACLSWGNNTSCWWPCFFLRPMENPVGFCLQGTATDPHDSTHTVYDVIGWGDLKQP